MLNIYSLCNKHCDGTIYNLSTYVCDRSWGAHKTFIHPLLFLKLGVTDGDDSLHTGGSFANVAVLVYTHRRVVLQCNGSKDLIMDGS